MLLKTYRILLFLAAPFLVALMWLRAMRGHEEKGHLKERRGIATVPRPQGRVVWIHAASVGEMQSIIPLVNRLLAQNDDLSCLITTVTVTAARLVRRIKNTRMIHQYAPLDRQAWVERFLNHWKPEACVWVESEFWPNTMELIAKRGTPLMLVNGRLSQRSADRWAMAPITSAHLLGLFDVSLAQSPEDGARLKSIGAKNIEIAGNMKYSGGKLPYDEAAYNLMHMQVGERPVVLFASTHKGEELMAAHAIKTISAKMPNVLGIIMPRHPKRGDAVAAELEKENLPLARRSLQQPIAANTQIYLADTLGEAGLFYRLAPIVYIGNSLISSPGGGHNPIEPAQLDCAIIYGPHMWNFSEVERDLRDAGGALLVRDERSLIAALEKLLSDRSKIDALASAAAQFVSIQNGVLDKVALHLRPTLAKAGIAA